MGINRSMSRENKKKQLRSQMVSPSVSSPEDEDSEELIKKAHQKSVKRQGPHWSSDRDSDFGRCGRIYIL